MLRVYNEFLDLLIETNSFQSLQFTRSFHGVGKFELHINKHLQGAEHFEKGNIIALDENKVALIQTREISLDEGGKGSENIVVSGYTLDGLLDRRITLPPAHTSHDRKTGNAETVIKHYVYNNFVNPKDKNRRIPNLIIAPNYNRGKRIEWESRYRNVAEEIEKISLESGLGWTIKADINSGMLIFDVIQPRDLTQGNQQANNPVFFSPDFQTVKSQTFINSDNDLRNYGYVAGQGEGVERKVIEIGEVSGWHRIEEFIDARDVSDEIDDEDRTDDMSEDETLTEEEVEALLLKRGNEKLSEMETLISFEAEILTPITRTSYQASSDGYLYPAQPNVNYTRKTQQITPFEYEADFDLGDYVSVVNKSWNLDLETPIVEVTEIHEQGGFRLEAVFGETRPTLTSKIKHKFEELDDIDKDEAMFKYVDKTNKKIAERIESNDALWRGIVFPNSNQEVFPDKALSDCKNGWVLEWQRFLRSTGVLNNNYSQTFISKSILKHAEGRHFKVLLARDNQIVRKTLYIYDGKLVGHVDNESAGADGNENLVLRGVYEW